MQWIVRSIIARSILSSVLNHALCRMAFFLILINSDLEIVHRIIVESTFNCIWCSIFNN
jgi:hypothetical protein